MSYEERLKFLPLPSLEFRRMRGDLIETYNVCNKIYDSVTTCDMFEMSTNNTRSNGLKIKKINCEHEFFKKFFTNRVINVWNRLPTHVASADSVNMFKNSFDKLHRELMYSINIPY